MTHPTREEWMSYLYDESPAESRVTLQAHLDSCAECRAQIAAWQSATQEMSEWQLPRPRHTRPRTFLHWAAAASIVALAVLGGVRLISLNREVQQLRAEMREQVQRELNGALAQINDHAARSANAEAQTLVAALAQNIEEKRLADQQAMFSAFQKLNTQRIADYAKLRKELETVALFSEVGLQRAENQISSLAYTPTSFSNEK